MARTDANPPMPEFRSDYVLYEVDAQWLSQAVKPKQFIDTVSSPRSPEAASAARGISTVIRVRAGPCCGQTTEIYSENQRDAHLPKTSADRRS